LRRRLDSELASHTDANSESTMDRPRSPARRGVAPRHGTWHGRRVDEARPTRILVVANRNVATHRLLDEVHRRAQAGPCEFALLIPDVGLRKGADWTFVSALPLMRRAAGDRVGSVGSGPHPFASVQNALRHGNYDEIIVSTLPKRADRWLRRDLVRRIQGLDLPVTVILPAGMTNKKAARLMVDIGGSP
jgi:hypothetical protein